MRGLRLSVGHLPLSFVQDDIELGSVEEQPRRQVQQGECADDRPEGSVDLRGMRDGARGVPGASDFQQRPAGSRKQPARDDRLLSSINGRQEVMLYFLKCLMPLSGSI